MEKNCCCNFLQTILNRNQEEGKKIKLQQLQENDDFFV
jgi:hypothetical protein